MNKILIIGCGSIGRRHIRALISLGERNIAAYRTGKGQLKELDDDIKDFVQIFKEETEAFAWNPSHVLICNPTKFHTEYLAKSMSAEAKVFVEKPIADDFSEIKKLPFSMTEIKNCNGVVGFNLRHHSLFSKIKRLLTAKKYGSVISARLMVGHYLPFWHPYEDYRKSYAASRELGGGALRTLCHEIDLAQYFFGRIQKVYAKIVNLNLKEIDVDDMSDIMAQSVFCKQILIHMDFLQPMPVRKGEILFEDGLLEYDYFSGKCFFTDYSKNIRNDIFSVKEDYDQQYVVQMQHYLARNSNISCTLEEGVEVMKIISACEESNKTGRTICLD